MKKAIIVNRSVRCNGSNWVIYNVAERASVGSTMMWPSC